MDAGARTLFPERLGRSLYAAARLVRQPRRSAQGRTTDRAIRQRQLHFYRVRLVPAVSGGRARRLSVVCESGQLLEERIASTGPQSCVPKERRNWGRWYSPNQTYRKLQIPL